ncbi:MAG: hypothetical protein QOH59_1909 [Gemmatimonadales bacterium]|jgi:hypothetical protein|nr:hypothetical protein [Gemmatimonadales bacterium]
MCLGSFAAAKYIGAVNNQIRVCGATKSREVRETVGYP